MEPATQADQHASGPEGTVALSRNMPGKPSKWRLSFMEGRQERVEPLDRANDQSSLSGEVEAVARGDRSMQQCWPNRLEVLAYGVWLMTVA
jgi:hypothetical protein